MYINTTTLEQIDEQGIRNLFPNVSFPQPFVAPEGYAYVFPTPSNHNSLTQTATNIAPELTNLGHWEQRWLVSDLPEETILANAESLRIARVPKEITMRQARLALLGAGLLSTVATTINAMSEPQKSAANIEWEYSNTVLRHNGFVSVLGPLLGLTEQQIDELFVLAATL